MTENLIIQKAFPSRRSALDFMQFLTSEEITIKKHGDLWVVVYIAARSIVDSEVVNDGGDPIITS